jgi:hypothetical protein
MVRGQQADRHLPVGRCGTTHRHASDGLVWPLTISPAGVRAYVEAAAWEALTPELALAVRVHAEHCRMYRVRVRSCQRTFRAARPADRAFASHR